MISIRKPMAPAMARQSIQTTASFFQEKFDCDIIFGFDGTKMSRRAALLCYLSYISRNILIRPRNSCTNP